VICRIFLHRWLRHRTNRLRCPGDSEWAWLAYQFKETSDEMQN
jgi:hypothetical protein